ncbi:MAG: hypothetical protein GWP91_19270 [Rhodobacterales bacterium]|nr:hypothetical protein [Rhodobacterales bacterium]
MIRKIRVDLWVLGVGLVALLAVQGCQSGGRTLVIGTSSSDTGTPLTTSTGTSTGTTTGTISTTTGTSTTGTTSPTPPLCAAIPAIPQTYSTITGIPTSEEFTFDALGHLLNINDSDDLLYQSDILGNTTVLAPYSSSEVGAIRFLIDGDLVVADEGSGALMRLGLNGSTQVLLGSIDEPNSIIIHPDGWIFTTAADQILRVDPDSVLPPEVMVNMPGHDLDGLTFSPNYDWFYFNSDDTGEIYKSAVTSQVRLDPPIEIVDLWEGFEQLDGMTVDECGSLYVTITDGRIRRIDPTTGAVQNFPQIPGGWTTSLHFGAGVGGWLRDHLYVMDRSGGIYDIPVGINGMWQPHHPAVTIP